MNAHDRDASAFLVKWRQLFLRALASYLPANALVFLFSSTSMCRCSLFTFSKSPQLPGVHDNLLIRLNQRSTHSLMFRKTRTCRRKSPRSTACSVSPIGWPYVIKRRYCSLYAQVIYSGSSWDSCSSCIRTSNPGPSSCTRSCRFS